MKKMIDADNREEETSVMIVTIHLHCDRSREGEIEIPGVEGHFRCLAESDHSAACAAGNPTRDPLRRLGNLPTGRYTAQRLPAPVNPSPATLRSYGPHARYLLTPISGDALRAAHNGRDGIEIHGGDIGAPMPDGALRPTHGCCRAENDTIAFMNQHLPASFEVDVIEDLVNGPVENESQNAIE